MAVTELFVERDINLYIYVYISLWHVWVAHSVRRFITKARRLDIMLPLGRPNFKEDHLSPCMFLLLLHDICFCPSYLSRPFQLGETRQPPSLYRSLTAYSLHVFRMSLNYFILLVSLFDRLFLLMTIITVARRFQFYEEVVVVQTFPYVSQPVFALEPIL